MDEPILNSHNKAGREPAYVALFDASFISKLALLIALLFIAGRAGAQEISSLPDTLSITVDRKVINIPCTYTGERSKHYETLEPFVERDTCYLYRSIDYYLENGEMHCDPSSYYVLSHKSKGHKTDVDKLNYTYLGLKAGEEFEVEELLSSQAYVSSNYPDLEPNELGKMPRVWYPLKKYRGNYYFSFDDNRIVEFTDKVRVVYGMEIWCEAFTDFKELPDGGWEFTLKDPYYKRNTNVVVKPAKHLKGIYTVTETTDGAQPEVSLWTTDKYIKRFDAIDWESSLEGCCNNPWLPYDEIDFDSIR